jgi:hypothetical protein
VAPFLRSGQRLHVSTFVVSTSLRPHAIPSRLGGTIHQTGSMSLSRSSFDEICCPNSADTTCHEPTPSHTPIIQSYPYAFIMADQLRGKRVLDIRFVLQETCLVRCHVVSSPNPSPPLGLVFCCCLGWCRCSVVWLGRFFW